MAEQLGHFRAALLALALTSGSTYLIKPVQAWLKALHDSVRDDRYLVGMRLQDHSDKVRILSGFAALSLKRLRPLLLCCGRDVMCVCLVGC